MARAIEASSRFAALRRPAFSRPWWVLRLVPSAVSLVAIGHTLGRGQVNALQVLDQLHAAPAHVVALEDKGGHAP